jgi:hypothetical protein
MDEPIDKPQPEFLDYGRPDRHAWYRGRTGKLLAILCFLFGLVTGVGSASFIVMGIMTADWYKMSGSVCIVLVGAMLCSAGGMLWQAASRVE